MGTNFNSQTFVTPYDDTDVAYPTSSSIEGAFEELLFRPSLWPASAGFWLNLAFDMEKRRAVRALWSDYKRPQWMTVHSLHYQMEFAAIHGEKWKIQEPVAAIDFNFLGNWLDAFLSLHLRFRVSEGEVVTELAIMHDDLVRWKLAERIRHLTNLKRVVRTEDWACGRCGVHYQTHEILAVTRIK